MHAIPVFNCFVFALLALGDYPLSAVAADIALDPKLGNVVTRCKPAPAGAPHVWIFKQWHAETSIDTHDRAQAKALPQAANQTSIFRQLDQWVQSGAIRTLVAEGCTGELDRRSTLKFNGWTVEDLEVEAKKPHFDDEIVASVSQKLEAKFGDRLKTVCGDDNALIRAHLMAFSDVRGTYGFLSRLLQHKDNPEKARNYLEGVIDLYKLPKTTTMDQATERMRSELGKAMGRLKDALGKRNEKVVGVVQAAAAPQIAVVFGGVHAPGLVKLLQDKGLGCTVIEPVGYNNDEASLMDQLEAAMKKIGRS